MKNLTSRISGVARTSAVVSLVVLVFAIVARSAGSQLTDDQLLARGAAELKASNWAEASVLLYAYQQRSPAAMASNPTHAAQVVKGYQFARNELATVIADRKRLLAEEQRRAGSNGVGRITSGIGFAPPALEATVAPPRDPAARRCVVYARVAVAQNEGARANSCGFQPNRWSSDYDMHYNHCIAAPAAAVKAETSERMRLLDQCAP